MASIVPRLKVLCSCERGNSATEYALIIVGIALATYAALTALGATLGDDFFGGVGTSLTGLDVSSD